MQFSSERFYTFFHFNHLFKYVKQMIFYLNSHRFSFNFKISFFKSKNVKIYIFLRFHNIEYQFFFMIVALNLKQPDLKRNFNCY